MAKVRCENCTHFRSAPYEAKHAGCYLPANMVGKQSDAFLDEQQVPGDHETINIRGDCADYVPKRQRPRLLQWLLSETG